ncbi:MAG: sugar kinase [Devosiaceae bacterium]|nr:sugar kinase [Devosiaceae bacterium MH13]
MPLAKSIVTVGEILVEFVSHERNCGLSRTAPYSGPYPSGAPAIFLDQAARMGAQTLLIGGVGEDGFGRCVLERLRADGVDTEGVTVSADHATGVAFVSYFDSGDRTFIFHLAGTAADNFAVPLANLSGPETLLHVSASSLGAPSLREKILEAVDTVSKDGGTISCDPNVRPELMRDAAAKAAVMDAVSRSAIVMPSTSDLEFLYPGLSEDQAIARLMENGAQIVAVKRGADGATVIGQDERYSYEPHSVEEVDPTGAGDCFSGTLIALLAQGAPLREAGRQANAAGAIAVTRRGPMEGNSSPDEIAAFLADASQIEQRA